jgi:phospholipid-binding lipoprotein MlaA
MSCMLLRFARHFALSVAIVASLSTHAIAEQPANQQAQQSTDIADPFEYVNRGIFEVNKFLDEIALKPLAAWYGVLPDRAREGTHNFLGNLKTPWTAVNDLAQGEGERLGNSVARFFINTLLGFFGTFDPAAHMGIPAHEEDAGQTFAVWGAGEGPYIMLPVFGPSNLRDAVGFAVDSFLDPVNLGANAADLRWVGPARGAASGIDARQRNWQNIEDLQRNSTDYYATIRRVYTDRRRAAILNRAGSENMPVPRMSDGDDSPAPASRADASRQ